ncbi:MAG: hypothetical protein AAF699_11810 [Pseudomonadota bacterium]
MAIRYCTRVGLLAPLIVLSACTNQAWYDGIQQHQQLECSKLPGSQYDECMKEVSQPYSEYEREYRELKEGGTQPEQAKTSTR